MDAGHLFKDTKTIVLAWGTDGVWLTTAEAIANTTFTGEAPWDVTRHAYARSVTVTRLVLCVVYFYTEFRSSNTIGEVRTLLQCHYRYRLGCWYPRVYNLQPHTLLSLSYT